jgi:hypothetical protein
VKVKHKKLLIYLGLLYAVGAVAATMVQFPSSSEQYFGFDAYGFGFGWARAILWPLYFFASKKVFTFVSLRLLFTGLELAGLIGFFNLCAKFIGDKRSPKPSKSHYVFIGAIIFPIVLVLFYDGDHSIGNALASFSMALFFMSIVLFVSFFVPGHYRAIALEGRTRVFATFLVCLILSVGVLLLDAKFEGRAGNFLGQFLSASHDY